MKQERIYNKKDTRVYKTEAVTLPSPQIDGEVEKPINQPNMILDARYNYRLIQLSAIVKITNILQPIINKNIDEYTELHRHCYYQKMQMPSRDYLLSNSHVLRIQMPNVIWKLDEKTLEVKLPLDAFTSTPSHYARVRAAIMDLTKIAVKYPEYSELEKKILTDGQRSLCMSVFCSKDSSQKNRSHIHLFFREEIARLLVNPCYGYSRLQQTTIDNCRSTYTAKIYMQICRHADGKKWAITYSELRSLLCIDLPAKTGNPRISTLPRYHEFRRRVLDIARDELIELAQHSQTNYYFTYAEEFQSDRHSIPQYIIFNIYETVPSKKDFEGYEQALKQMQHYAREYLKIGTDRCARVFKNISLRNYTYVLQRHLTVWSYISAHEKSIKDYGSYYLKSIENAIREEKTSHEHGVIQMNLKF